MHAEHENVNVIFTFCTTSRLQNAKIIQKIPSCATFLSIKMNEYGMYKMKKVYDLQTTCMIHKTMTHMMVKK